MLLNIYKRFQRNIINLFVGFFIILLCISFSSCEEEINLNFTSINSGLVVEGYIQQDFPAYVFLSRTQPYFSEIDSNLYEDILVDNANVCVRRNDGIIHELTYLSKNIVDSLNLMQDTIDIPLYGFYIDLDYKKDNFSQVGYKYTLLIEWNEDTISGVTEILPQYPIDSVWVKLVDSEINDYKCYIWASINDPDTVGNSVSIYYKRDVRWKPIDSLFIPCALSLRSDFLANGENFTTFFARSGRMNDDDGVLLPFYGPRIINNQFYQEDIVILRFAHIDQDVYRFWRSAQIMTNNRNNPFIEPLNLQGNINGGYGIWGGYSASYYYIPIIPDTIIFDTYNNISISNIF